MMLIICRLKENSQSDSDHISPAAPRWGEGVNRFRGKGRGRGRGRGFQNKFSPARNLYSRDRVPTYRRSRSFSSDSFSSSSRSRSRSRSPRRRRKSSRRSRSPAPRSRRRHRRYILLADSIMNSL